MFSHSGKTDFYVSKINKFEKWIDFNFSRKKPIMSYLITTKLFEKWQICLTLNKIDALCAIKQRLSFLRLEMIEVLIL